MVGLSAAVAAALVVGTRSVDFVSVQPGEKGAVREVCEMLLMAQGHWAQVSARYDF